MKYSLGQYRIQFFALYNLLVMVGLHFPGEKFPRPNTMKMTYSVIAHRFLVTLDSPRIYVGVLVWLAFDVVFRALQRPYHRWVSFTWSKIPQAKYHKMAHGVVSSPIPYPKTAGERVIRLALNEVFNALQPPYHDQSPSRSGAIFRLRYYGYLVFAVPSHFPVTLASTNSSYNEVSGLVSYVVFRSLQPLYHAWSSFSWPKIS